ncbi:hypothetical protein PV11_00103 [Exophiala sideris]|uniref:Mid2 domain-containing protein n=1 Tax=Exophiala sideris TaxID=1016849 RepID=A0A0D1X916_9EURO|nr:hypothetical protein PV11_00103 [Exophiala sideris]
MLASCSFTAIRFCISLTLLSLIRPCQSQGSSEPKPPGRFILPADAGDTSESQVDYTFEYGSLANFQWATNDNATDLEIYNAAGSDTAQTSFNGPLVWSSDFGDPYGTAFYLQIVSEDTDYTIATSVYFTVVPAGSNPSSSAADTSSDTPTTTESINSPLTLPTTTSTIAVASTPSVQPLVETSATTDTSDALSTTTSESAAATTTDTASPTTTTQDTTLTSSSPPRATQTAFLPPNGSGAAKTSSDPDNESLIIGLSTGLGLTALSAALACLLLLRRHKRRRYNKQKNTPQAAEKGNVAAGAHSHERHDSVYRMLPLYSPSDELSNSRFYSRSDWTGMGIGSNHGSGTIAELPSPPSQGIGKPEPDHLIELPG